MDREDTFHKNSLPNLWHQAVGLRERLLTPSSIYFTEKLAAEQIERATKRLNPWQKIFGNDEALYKEWLDYSDLSEPDLLKLLSETPDELRQRLSHPPTWFHTFSKAFELYTESDDIFWESMLAVNASSIFMLPQGQKQGGVDIRLLLTVVEPLIHMGRQLLLEGIQNIKQEYTTPLFATDTLLSSLLSTLILQLQDLLNRALILEFRVAQRQGTFSEGETLQESLQMYAHYMRSHESAFAFFSEYPVLARQVTICVEQWYESNMEMLTRLSQDWSTLQTLFCSDQDPGILQQVDSRLGDRHRGGRSVQALIFTSGFRLVYKPRSLAIDVHFQELLQWLNDHGQNPSFHVLQVIDCTSHGWVEWVEAHDCTSTEEIQRFYLRQGANLALLYALEATDFHYENILAAGEYPMLVDLESLIHVHTKPSFTSLGPVEQIAYGNVSSSVLRTLLLPYRPLEDGDQTWAELSGLGGAPGQILPTQVLQLSGFDTGELHFARARAILQGGKNRPHLNGKEVDIFIYLSHINEGFSSTYRLLLAYRQELLAEHGPLAKFATDITRVVLRPTLHYWQLLHASRHPYVLHDELDQERIRNVLWRITSDQPQMKLVIPSELEALRQGDIPLFTTRVASRDLWTNANERISNFFECSGFESLQQHWQNFSERDLERQLWFIHVSFATLMPLEELQQTSTTHPSLEVEERHSAPSESHEELCLAACKIGDRICQLATVEKDSATWLELAQVKEQWQLVLADVNVYSGLTGIILALAYLGMLTHIEQYTIMARKAFTTLHGRIVYDRHEMKNVGFFAGWGGVIAVLVHLAVLWQEDELLHEASSLVEILPPFIEQDESLDLVRGSAGCIAGLLSLDAIAPSLAIEAALLQCGEHLAAHAISLQEGIGWRVFEETDCLTGVAHGNAGIAWALLKLARRTGETRFRQLALDALSYERSLYNPVLKNWRDMRSPHEGEATYRLAWCYGAPGIGLARLDTLPILDDQLVRAEIQAALETTLAEGFGTNHSLCHGDLGNLELLYRAQKILPDKRWQAAYELLKTATLEQGHQFGWLCGTPQQVETPGLMIGLAGICLQLLRLAEPEYVPSILTMDPPSALSTMRSDIFPNYRQ